MRTASLVLLAYALGTVLGAMWRLLPVSLLHDATPHIGALTATYLGLHARGQMAPAIAGSVVLGYLLDLVYGQPVGFAALTLALVGLVAVFVQRRILVRGLTMTVAFCAFVGGSSAVIGLVVRSLYDVPLAGAGTELLAIVLATLATAVVGPGVWRLFRRVDAAFARTHRERDAALEGLVP